MFDTPGRCQRQKRAELLFTATWYIAIGRNAFKRVIQGRFVNFDARQHACSCSIKQLWRSNSRSIEVVAAFSGVHDLRAYLQMHEHLGEPAIRKIARQVLKGAPSCTRTADMAPDLQHAVGRGSCVA